MMATGSRSVNASSAERSLLLGVIASHLGVLDARDNDSRTLRHKSLLWDQVTKKFNSLSSLPRSRHQIQTLYKNMKAKAKKYQLRMMEAQLDNAPHAIPEPDPISEVLLQLLAGEHEQRRMQLKQTAFNVSVDLSSSLPVDNDTPGHFSPRELHNSTPVECSPDIGPPAYGIKNEPSGSDRSMIETSLLGEETSLGRSAPKSPEGNAFESFPNAVDDSSSVTSRPNSAENNSPGSSSPERVGIKRSRPSSMTFLTDNQPQHMTHHCLRDFNDGIHNLKFTDSQLPTYPGNNRQCCCPNLHAELVAMAKEEHELRIRTVEEESRFKAEQHKAKIKLLELEQELCKKKLKLSEKIITANEQQQGENSPDQNATLVQALSQLEKLCQGSSSITMNPEGALMKNQTSLVTFPHTDVITDNEHTSL